MKTFADTFFFLAFLNPDDRWHEDAAMLMDAYQGELVTTEWVLVELADGMAEPRVRNACVEFIEALRNDPQVRVRAQWDCII